MELIKCNDCGAVTEGVLDYGIILCSDCKSPDVEPMRCCERCGELTPNRLCDDCTEEIDRIISDAIADIENAPNGRLDYRTARDLFLERIEELE